MKKIKVLMLGWEYPPYVTGGLGIHCYCLTRALAKLSVEIYFITPHPIHKRRGNLEIIGLDISQKFKEGGVIVSYGSFTREKIDLYNQKIPKIIKKYHFDIIHSQDTPPIDAAILSKKLSGKPLVMTIHSTAYDGTKKPRMRIVKRQKRGMENADKIIAVSNYTKQIIIKRYNIDSKKVSVIINAVKQKKAPPRKRIDKTIYILYLGRLAYQKGIPYLIKATKKVLKEEENVKLLIVGKGSPLYEEKLKNQVKRLGLEKNVIFLGYRENKNYYYKKAYLFVMPSFSEPFGITPLEALINGTPAIISRQSGISETLRNCLKFDHWDVDDLAKKILFLVRNKKAYNKLRREGLKEVKNFTWEGIAADTLALYKKVLKSN